MMGKNRKRLSKPRLDSSPAGSYPASSPTLADHKRVVYRANFSAECTLNKLLKSLKLFFVIEKPLFSLKFSHLR